MKKKLLFPLMVLGALLAAAFITSCNKASDELTVDNMVDQALYTVQDRGGLGKYGCYELVFPVTITMPDGTTTVTVNSYDELRTAMRTWFEANGSGNHGQHPHQGPPFGGQQGWLGAAGHPHPTFVFPISVITQEGETVVVNDETELQALRGQCAGSFGQHGWQGFSQHGLSCFQLIFPVTIQFPDGTTATVQSGQEMGNLMRTWRQNNPGVTTRPTLVFPVSVKMRADGTVVSVENKDALIALKADCQ